MKNDLIDFYIESRPDHQGRYLKDILAWSDDDLESVHDYIQWLFPLVERSGFNRLAPVLDAETIQELRSRQELQSTLRDSFIRMLAFYGLVLTESKPLVVRAAPNFKDRATNWLARSDHNHLRITRILKSLTLLGLGEEATAFFACLQQLYRQQSSQDLPTITPETFRYWRAAVDIE